MESVAPNLLNIETIVSDFIEKHKDGIATMHRIYFHSNDQLSIRALTEELKDELRNGCVTFFNKDDASSEELDPYLFYITNSFCKKRAIPIIKRKIEYICPGCAFLKKETLVPLVNKLFKCEECEESLKQATDPKKLSFFRAFFKHSKNGYHCQDCDRFIPHPLDNSPIVSCPYFDCCFVGSWANLGRMHHPSISTNPEKLILDATDDIGFSMKDSLSDDGINADTSLEIKEELDSKVKLIKEIIDFQSNNVPYSSSDFTVKHKLLVYQAFSNLLKEFPAEMVGYLLNKTRSGGFQHKVFQEYIKLLESSLPYNIKKNNKLYKIESLLDENLCLFNGVSTFEAIVNDKLEIKNNTQEFYIGGRKATYTKPFYIGKLLSVMESKTKKSLLDQVVEYSFSKIKMRDIEPGTEVIVTHLRVPPHYQMGGMVYVNRVRKKIVDRANYLANKDINVTSFE